MELDMLLNPGKYFTKGRIGYKIEDNPAFDRVRKTLVAYNMPTKLFDENLSKLEMVEDHGSKTGQTFGFVLGSYDAKRNKIIAPEDNKDLIHEVFHMASNRKDESANMGVLEYGRGQSLNEGITDMFSYFSTLYEDEENKYEVRYPVEKLMSEFLGSLYGMKIFKHQFDCDPKGFMNEFGVDKDRVSVIISELDTYTRRKNDFINLKEIDFNELASAFVNAMGGFIDLASSKNPAYGNIYFELIRSMLRQPYESVESTKKLLEISDFGSIDNILDVIASHSFGESSHL